MESKTKEGKDNEPAPLSEIVPDGDLVLVVGPDKERLRVGSHSLCLASRVFKAMLGPNWNENQESSSTDPCEVELPEDDADAFRTILCVMNLRNEHVPTALEPEKLLHVAIISDKYDLNVALKFALMSWLEPKPVQVLVEAGLRAAAAWLFHHETAFQEQIKRLIMEQKGSYWALMSFKPMIDALPAQFMFILEERRNRVRLSLLNLLEQGVRDECRYCEWGLTRRARCQEILNKYWNPEVDCRSVGALTEMIQEAPLQDTLGNGALCSCYGTTHTPTSYDLECIKGYANSCFECFRGDITKIVRRCKHKA